MSPEEQQAATVLGYSERLWDTEWGPARIEPRQTGGGAGGGIGAEGSKADEDDDDPQDILADILQDSEEEEAAAEQEADAAPEAKRLRGTAGHKGADDAVDSHGDGAAVIGTEGTERASLSVLDTILGRRSQRLHKPRFVAPPVRAADTAATPAAASRASQAKDDGPPVFSLSSMGKTKEPRRSSAEKTAGSIAIPAGSMFNPASSKKGPAAAAKFDEKKPAEDAGGAFTFADPKATPRGSAKPLGQRLKEASADLPTFEFAAASAAAVKSAPAPKLAVGSTFGAAAGAGIGAAAAAPAASPFGQPAAGVGIGGGGTGAFGGAGGGIGSGIGAGIGAGASPFGAAVGAATGGGFGSAAGGGGIGSGIGGASPPSAFGGGGIGGGGGGIGGGIGGASAPSAFGGGGIGAGGGGGIGSGIGAGIHLSPFGAPAAPAAQPFGAPSTSMGGGGIGPKLQPGPKSKPMLSVMSPTKEKDPAEVLRGHDSKHTAVGHEEPRQQPNTATDTTPAAKNASVLHAAADNGSLLGKQPPQQQQAAEAAEAAATVPAAAAADVGSIEWHLQQAERLQEQLDTQRSQSAL